MLKSLQQNETVISLYFPDRPDKEYASSVFEVGRGTLLLDQVSDSEGHEALLARRKFRAMSKYKGVTVTFDCHLAGLQEDGDGVRYQVAFPERVFYPQLRETFRLKIHDLQIPIHIRGHSPDGAGETVAGQVDDIGYNGVGFILESNLFIRKLDVLRYCVIRLGEDRNLTFDLRVCNVRAIVKGRRYRIGGKFVNLSGRNAALIRREVTRFQRLLRQQEREGGSD
ncbi:flagellar brake protein [Methylomarinovum caldicuralii]|uniref:Flagellar brake protein n=2 Tax=Methylomarinovum caldicuralii TaxID=438856 RepID=A0AAU9C6T9_9GAMM|nr:flagellar brake protein [Methylomarinovum caldicuralii]